MPDNRTKEPTNKDIIDELKRSHTITLLTFYASVAVIGLVLVASVYFPVPQYPLLYGLTLAIIGIGFFLDASIRHYRRKRN